MNIKNMIYTGGEYVEMEKIPEEEMEKISEKILVTFAQKLGYERCVQDRQQ